MLGSFGGCQVAIHQNTDQNHHEYFFNFIVQTDTDLVALRNDYHQLKFELLRSDNETRETLIAVNSTFIREVCEDVFVSLFCAISTVGLL